MLSHTHVPQNVKENHNLQASARSLYNVGSKNHIHALRLNGTCRAVSQISSLSLRQKSLVFHFTFKILIRNRTELPRMVLNLLSIAQIWPWTYNPDLPMVPPKELSWQACSNRPCSVPDIASLETVHSFEAGTLWEQHWMANTHDEDEACALPSPGRLGWPHRAGCSSTAQIVQQAALPQTQPEDSCLESGRIRFGLNCDRPRSAWCPSTSWKQPDKEREDDNI